MTRYACNFVPMYKSYIETKHENRDRLGLSEMGQAGYLWTRPRIFFVRTSKMRYFTHISYVTCDLVGIIRNEFYFRGFDV